MGSGLWGHAPSHREVRRICETVGKGRDVIGSDIGTHLRWRVWGLEFRVKGLGRRVKGIGYRDSGLTFRVWGLRVYLRCRV